MKLVDLATRRRVTIAMFTVAILLFGSVALSRLKINLLPDLSFPTLTVRTEYVGAAPAEIETLISKPIEEALGVVKNVEQLRSVSRTGQSDVVLEFAWGTNMDFAVLEVREQLDALVLPLEASRPVLLRFDPTLDPIVRLGLYRDGESSTLIAANTNAPISLDRVAKDDGRPLNEALLKELRRFADEQVKKALESAPGVAAAKVSGGLEDEVQVHIDQQRLSQLGISVGSITSVLRTENVNLSGGRLEEGVHQYLVRTLNQFQSIDEIGDVLVEHVNGVPVYLRDVASVRLGYSERESITRIDGIEAVEIAIYKEGDANTVAVARAVDEHLDRARDLLPPGLKLVKVYDQSTYIQQAIDEVVFAGLIGGLLAVLILYFFLRDFASTLIISLSIPVSVIATFNLMYGFDLTLNIMSLGGLALGIGLLVDNSIVVLENIARHRAAGKDRVTAARDGAGEVGRAVVASTLTTVAVFFPLVFVQGIAGQLFRDQALTVTFSLLASLAVAITLIPMLSSLGGSAADPVVQPALREPRTRIGRLLRAVRVFIFNTLPSFVARIVFLVSRLLGRLAGYILVPFVWLFSRLDDGLASKYPGLVRWALHHRATVLVVAVSLFGGSILLLPRLGVELIPELAQGAYDVEFRLPPGTPLERTDALMADMQQLAAENPNIRLTFAAAGSGNRMDANPDQGGENWGELHVALHAATDETDEASTMSALRGELARIPGLRYKFSRPTLFTFDTPIEIEVAGYDIDALRSTSEQLAAKLAASDRFADVKSSMELGHPEIQLHFDRERAAALGLAVHDIAETVVSKVRGDVATRYSWHDRKIDVFVRAAESDRSSIEQLGRLIINPESNRPVPLSTVADIVVETGPSEIRRVGQQRVAVVTANLKHGDLGSAAAEIQHHVATTRLPAGLAVRLAGQSEEMSMSFRSLLFALALAVFLVYLVMASQFESFVHPLVIFFTIPLAVIGAVAALWITGSTISVVVFIGFILLAGIVVNNAIVLVDLINQLREQGLTKIEAIVEGGRLRLRPILMTTLTTALGLLPLAMGFGEGAELRAPMAVTVIGGLLVSTVLTLVVIPVMYAVIDRAGGVQE